MENLHQMALQVKWAYSNKGTKIIEMRNLFILVFLLIIFGVDAKTETTFGTLVTDSKHFCFITMLFPLVLMYPIFRTPQIKRR